MVNRKKRCRIQSVLLSGGNNWRDSCLPLLDKKKQTEKNSLFDNQNLLERGLGREKTGGREGRTEESSPPFPQTPIPPLSKTFVLIESLPSACRAGGGSGGVFLLIEEGKGRRGRSLAFLFEGTGESEKGKTETGRSGKGRPEEGGSRNMGSEKARFPASPFPGNVFFSRSRRNARSPSTGKRNDMPSMHSTALNRKRPASHREGGPAGGFDKDESL